MTEAFVQKQCLFCEDQEILRDLYERSFEPDDLNPAVFSARRVTEHFHYKMVACRNCSLVFSREVLDDQRLTQLYGQSAFTFGEHTETLRRDYWRPLAPYAQRVRGGTALEVGCSSGFFLEELRDRGMDQVFGCEPSVEAKTHACPEVRKNILSSFFEGKRSFPDTEFDLVCSFHTLDHVSNPLDFLKQAAEVLRPGGLVYLVTHDVNSLQARLLGERSPIIDVEHIYLFNRRTLRLALERAGFECLRTGRLTNSYPLRYWTKMFPMAPLPKRWLTHAMRWTGLAGLAPPLPMGNIFALGRKG